MRRFEKIDQSRQHTPDRAAALSNERHGDRIRFLDSSNHIVERQATLGGEDRGKAFAAPSARMLLGMTGNRSAAGDRLEAAAISAVAERIVPNIDVPDFARMLRRATVYIPIAHDPSADAVADLDEDHVVWRHGRAERALAKSHGMDVVVDEAGTGEVSLPEFSDGIALPTRHQRERRRSRLREAHWARYSHAQSLDVGRLHARPFQHAQYDVLDMRQGGFGTAGDVDIVG